MKNEGKQWNWKENNEKDKQGKGQQWNGNDNN